MWRTRAVIAMLIEEVACLRMPRPDDESGPPATVSESLELLRKAARRARWIILLDVAAIAVLFFFRDASGPFLASHRAVDSIFTLGVLAVAAHAGFRSAQLWSYRNIDRICDELQQRDDG